MASPAPSENSGKKEIKLFSSIHFGCMNFHRHDCFIIRYPSSANMHNEIDQVPF
jgi:hypothetical protein